MKQVVWIALMIVLCGAACGGPKPLELAVSQADSAAFSNYIQKDLRQSDTGWFDETCDDRSFLNVAAFYELELKANSTYRVEFYNASLTCPNGSIVLDANLYVFAPDSQLLVQAMTNDQWRATFDLMTESAGLHRLVVAPKFQDDEAGYSLRVFESSGL